jgi:hypothetical protein
VEGDVGHANSIASSLRGRESFFRRGEALCRAVNSFAAKNDSRPPYAGLGWEAESAASNGLAALCRLLLTTMTAWLCAP